MIFLSKLLILKGLATLKLAFFLFPHHTTKNKFFTFFVSGGLTNFYGREMIEMSEMFDRKEKKMAEIKTVEQPVTVQGLLNLETGNEESVSFKYERIVSAAGASVQDLMKYASLTDADLAEAVVSYINSRNYSEAKSAEVGEQFLTPDVRKNIVLFLRQNSAYAEMSASDVFNRWKKAYLEGTAGAKKVLEIVKNIKALEL